MKRLCIIPCGQKKIWDETNALGPAQARNVYIGSFSVMCKRYAETFYPDGWCILSAKYGFLFPDDIVPGPYNVTFNHKKTHPITLDELRAQAKEKGLLNYERVVVLGGKNYVNMIKAIFPEEVISTPLEGCAGIGYMMGRLKEAMQQNRPFV